MKNRMSVLFSVGGIVILLLLVALQGKAQDSDVVQLPFVLKGYPVIQSGQVVFVSDRDGDPEIFRMDYDGSNVIQLTYNTSLDSDPDWSPDGSRIVFSSELSGSREIYVMDADGSNLFRLTDMTKCRDPQWSPDGSRIVFNSQQLDSEIFTMDPDGSNLMPVTPPEVEASYPYWSPDGTRIAYFSILATPPGVYVIDVEGGDSSLLFEYELISGVAWSSDGRWLAMALMVEPSYTYDIFLYDLENETLTRLTDTTINHFDVDWFPLGNYLVFHALEEDPASAEIYTMTKEGLLLQNISNHAGADFSPDWTP